ncbi:ATP-binding protein [Solicola sp. PLA-1-18]|uniref:ATP-binding protein n=1 Tax=Solicola sp. PLA-1-18 TaxID=3380532 RepID=UPI003B804BD4
MPPVRLSIAADPANVRVARLVAVAMARARGYAEPVVDDVRLAVGEACGRAVLTHLDGGIDEQVVVELVGDETGLDVRVTDAEASDGGAPLVTLHDESGDPAVLAAEGIYLVDAVAVVGGVADSLDVSQGPTGTTLAMHWAPTPAPTA